MQTDVKIGVIVGLLLAAAVIIYFVAGGSGPGGEQDEDILSAGDLKPAAKTNQLVRKDEAKAPARPSEASGSAKATKAAPQPKPAPAAKPAAPPEPPKLAKAPAKDAVIPAYEPPKPPTTPPPSAKAAAEAAPAGRKVPPKPSSKDAVVVVPAKRSDGPAAGRTYTVQEDDYGFWTISEKVYGDGAHYKLIAEANPDVTTATLRAGKVLKIPPLVKLPAPAPLAEKPRPVAAPARPAPGGQRTYTVQAGDAGFWGVSKKVYGQGKYFYLLKRANPGVDSGALRPGQTLIVPQLATGSRTAIAPVAGRAPAAKPTGGGSVYVVEHGDAGFWGIAEKVYGDGAYYLLIARANPSADSSKLKAGQKLIVPPLTAEARAAVAAAAKPKSRPRARDADDERPYFEEY